MNKKLFAFDLDGTLLSDSSNSLVSKSSKELIKDLVKQGHVVCILTGRPWSATEKIYKYLKLDTLVANFNGAHLHNPTDYSFIPIVNKMDIFSVMRIVKSNELKKISENISIETMNKTFLKYRKEGGYLEETFLKGTNEDAIVSPIDWKQMTVEPIGVLAELKPTFAQDVTKIKNYFEGLYGDAFDITYWDTNENPILEITSKLSSKDIALIKMARYYGIPMADVVAFGDGFNDVPMLKIAGTGVAMNNASEIVKSYANVVSKYSNKNNGIAKFLSWYLDKGYVKVDKTIYAFKKGTTEQVSDE